MKEGTKSEMQQECNECMEEIKELTKSIKVIK